ncbi:MAG: sugar transferase [Candidatus Edwardsbacteria bacterium]|nr:sugar transferase [Candidatus Edwardsbacteria bacterium]
MIWRSSLNSRIAQLVDFLTGIAGFATSYLLWGLLYDKDPKFFPRPFSVGAEHIYCVLFCSALYVVLFDGQKAYSYLRFTSLETEYNIVIRVVGFAILVDFFFLHMLGYRDIPRTVFILSLAVALIYFAIQKTMLFYLAALARRRGHNRKRVIIIGTGHRARMVAENAKKHHAWGLDIIGLLTADDARVGKEYFGIKVLDNYRNIEEIIKSHNPEEVIVTSSTKSFDQLRDVFDKCELAGIPIRLISDFLGSNASNVHIDNVYGLNVISLYLAERPEWKLAFKRLMDIILSLAGIVLLLPLYAVIALIILIQDGRPVLYGWNVVGYKRKPIKSWKFRTMVRNADELKKNLMDRNEMSGPVFKITNDPRIIPIGHFLRKYSLDELPQLFSVLKGDLSLVGPRPPLQYEYREFDIWHRRKLSVKPGLTCLWQVSGRNDIVDFNEWARLDLAYIDNWSLWLDIKILIKTIPAVLMSRGAK